MSLPPWRGSPAAPPATPGPIRGADDLAAYAGLHLDPRDLGRMIAALAPSMREALATLEPAAASAAIPLLYASCDGTGIHTPRGTRWPQRQPRGLQRPPREDKLGSVFIQTVTDDHAAPRVRTVPTSYTGTFHGFRDAAIVPRQKPPARTGTYMTIRGRQHWIGRRIVFMIDVFLNTGFSDLPFVLVLFGSFRDIAVEYQRHTTNRVRTRN